MKKLIPFLFALLLSSPCWATNFYVDYTNGNDSNSGQSKTTPFKRAPGMNGCTGQCALTIPQPGDSVILKGCVTWPNAAFSWTPPSAGVAGNPAYYGVDTSWWDNTVSGCSTTWNRPVFNLGNAAPSDGAYRVIILSSSYIILDNFEIKNVAALASSSTGHTEIFDWGPAGSAQYRTVENMYIHGWNNPYFSVGTGNLTNGSSIVTNYSPFSYSPAANWTLPCITSGCLGGIELEVIGTGTIVTPVTVTSVSPSSGQPGQTLTIIGTGFTSPATVTFTCPSGSGSVYTASSVNVVNPTTITATFTGPSLSTGGSNETCDVTVTIQ